MDTEIRTPSTQSLTNFVQTGGTFTACADSVDGTTCDYQEGDAGDGEIHDIMLLPSGNDVTTDWIATGCAEATEYQCVDEGPSHDGNTTYVSTTTEVTSRYLMADCPANVCIAGTTYLSSSTRWAYALRVAGAESDPDLILNLYAGETICESSLLAVTLAYTNVSTNDPLGAGCMDSLSELNDARVRIEYSDGGLPPGDPLRVTVVGLTYQIRHPNYRGTVQYDFTNVKKNPTSDSSLVIRMAVAAGETWVCDVFDWLSNSYDASVLTFTSTTQAEQTYDLIENDQVSTTGAVRFRCVDQNQAADETQSTISIDSAFVRTLFEDDTNIGGGDLGRLLTLQCYPGLLSTPCIFDLSPQAIGVLIERTDWYADGNLFANGARVTGNRHTATLEGFRLQETVNVTVLAHFTNGQTFSVSQAVLIDNTWLAVFVFFLVVVIVGAIAARALVRRVKHADQREKQRSQAGSSDESWRKDLWKE